MSEIYDDEMPTSAAGDGMTRPMPAQGPGYARNPGTYGGSGTGGDGMGMPYSSSGGGSGWDPWASGGWGSPPPPRRRNGIARAIMAVVVIAAIAIGIGIGRVSGSGSKSPTADNTSHGAPPTSNAQQVPPNPGSSASGSPAPNAGASADPRALAAAVDPGIVDVNTQLSYQQAEAAGTGIVLNSSGEILTNNHVISGATSISVTDIGNGRTYKASVVGYDRTHDIAVLKLQNASGLATVTLGDSTKVGVGDSVVALGNAEGRGGTPAVAPGSVTGLDQSITASDQASGTSEHLSGLIQVDAGIQPGDSGGPLVAGSGQVVGIDTAASDGFQFQSGGNQGFAIPINQAITIGRQILAGQASSTVHIGATGMLGVNVASADQSGQGSGASGAAVQSVLPGSPAQQDGLTAGDVITSLNGQTVSDPNSLTDLLAPHHPGDTVKLGWTDGSGQSHTSNIQLANGPAA